MNSVLELDGIGLRFGGVRALSNVTYSVSEGELVGFIGPNGAGKTTALRVMLGVYKPNTGTVRLRGENVTPLPIHRRIHMGMALTHQIVRPFRSMTVLDNVVLAAGRRRIRQPLASLFQKDRRRETEKAHAMLERVGLGPIAHQSAEGLPLGQLKRLEVARALALEPSLLLLDEPLAGLNHREAAQLADTIVDLNTSGLTIILVEHNLGEVLRITSRLVVLDSGEIIADGKPDEVMAQECVRDAYIGKKEECHAEA